jgi:hypothetical protein
MPQTSPVHAPPSTNQADPSNISARAKGVNGHKVTATREPGTSLRRFQPPGGSAEGLGCALACGYQKPADGARTASRPDFRTHPHGAEAPSVSRVDRSA